MKYLKTYESNEPKILNYKVNDYIITTDIDPILPNVPLSNKNKSEILIIKSIMNTGLFDYYVSTLNNQTYLTKDKKILRKLTPEEIEIIKLNIAKEKYNL